jgi:subtilisin-like proprotein convertase family protein
MRALSTATIRHSARPIIGAVAILLALALLVASFGANLRTARAASAPDAPDATFPGTGVGAIPDSPGGTPPVYGTPLVVSYNVTGITAPITDVAVSITLTHSWVGDLDVVLRAPGGSPSQTIFSRVGALTATSFGSSSDLSGTYNFTDSAAGANFWTAAAATPVPAGNYKATAPGPVAASPAPTTTITTTFAGLSTAQANGTWTLTIRDGGGGDTGSVTASTLTVSGQSFTPQHVVDFDGDGKTDPAVVRNTGGGPSGQITWFYQNSGTGTSVATPWGIATDFFVPEDYDGDNKTDVAVWRPGAPFNSFFYILQSSTGTLRTDTFGQSGDDPTVVGDYDGDGKSDPAVYRAGAAAGNHSFWYYRSSVNGLIIGTEWGQNGDFPSPGDYDGDGKNDYVVQRNGGGGQAIFFFNNTTSGQSSLIFGTPTDVIVPGDYDGDLKTDVATIRGSGGNILWNIRNSNGGTTSSFTFGNSATDFPTQGDWDGDGKTDIAVWRPNADPTMDFFFWRRSTDGVNAQTEWGQNGDYPVANFNAH